MTTFAFRYLPTTSDQTTTQDLEQLQVLLSEGLSAENLKAEGISESRLAAAVVAKLNPSAWATPESFSAKLEETATCQVRTEQGKTTARLKGSVQAKEEIPAGTALFTLPVGYRPAALVHVPGVDITVAGGALQEIFVTTAGVVESSLKVTVAHVVVFDSISFHLT